MPKLLGERIKNGTIGDLLLLLTQLNEIWPNITSSGISADRSISSVINSGSDRIHQMIIDMLFARVGRMMLEKSPKVDHREYVKMKHLMSEIGFQVVKLDDNGEDVGVELDAGDYSQRVRDGREVVVERKSDDFFSSVFDGRIFNQLAEISENGNILCGFLILDKSINDLLNTAKEMNISENVVFGSLASCCLRGYPPVFVGDMTNFRKLVESIFNKAYDGKDRIIRPKLEVGKGEDIVVFPGVAAEKGRRLYEHFGSIKAIVNASKEELMQVKGIGAKLADKIIEVVN